MVFRSNRRHFLAGSGAVLTALGFGLGPALAQDKRLRLIFWGSQPRADRTYGVTDLYTKANPGLDIEGEFLGWADYWPKLATQTAGGNSPDVIQMDYRYIVEYAKRGALAPLDELMGSALNLGDFDEDQIEGGKVDGKLYGISLGTNSGATLYNASAIAEAGVELDPASMTYDDLLTAGEAFSNANIRNGMKLTSDGSGVELLLENWLRQKGKALYTPEGEPAFAAEDLVEWFTLWANLRDAGACIGPDAQAEDTGPIETTVLTTGKAATAFTTSNQLVAFQALNSDDIGIGIYPKISADATGGHYRKPSQFFSIGGRSQSIEDAAKFINFFVTDAEAGKILGVERGIPCSAAIRDALAPELDDKSRQALEFVANLGDLIGPLPPAPPAAAGEIEVALRTKSQEVAFGMQSPADAGPAFLDDVAGILARAS